MDEKADGADSERADTYHNYDLLQRITYWASSLSLVFFGVGVLLLIVGALFVLPVVVEFPGNVLHSPEFSPFAMVQLLGVFTPLLAGVVSLFLGVMCRAIEQGLFLLMDIEENAWRVVKKLAATTTASDSTPAS